MRLAKFARDVSAELTIMGYPLTCVFGTEVNASTVVTEDVAIFEYAPDQWTADFVAPGTEMPPTCTRFVGCKVNVRGIARINGATRGDHADWVGTLTEMLVVAIERVRKRAHWLIQFGSGETDVPKPGDQPEQGARYELVFHIGVPVMQKALPTAAIAAFSGTTKAFLLDQTTFDVVCTG